MYIIENIVRLSCQNLDLATLYGPNTTHAFKIIHIFLRIKGLASLLVLLLSN